MNPTPMAPMEAPTTMSQFIIRTLKSLYATPSPKHDIREFTLAPLFERAQNARTELVAVTVAWEDTAYHASTIDIPRLARYLEPDLVPVVERLRVAALEVRRAGDADELIEMLYTALGQIDAVDDRQFESATQLVQRTLDRVEGSVRALRAHVAVMKATLNTLAAAERLASETVNIPKLAEHGFVSAEVK